MRKFFSVLVAVAMCICLVVPAFAADGLDSLSSLFEGVDIASMSDTELSSVLEGLNLEGFDLDSIRSAFGDSGSEKSDALSGLQDTIGSIGTGDSGALSGLTDTIGAIGSGSVDSPISGISDAIDSIKGDDSAITDSVTAGLSELFGGMDMSWLSGVVSDPSSLLEMFSGKAADSGASSGGSNGGSSESASDSSGGGFDFGAIMDMISGAFGGAGFDIASLTGGMDLGSFDIASVLSGAGNLGSLLGGGDTAGKVSDTVASISDMLKGGLEQLGLDPSIIDKLFDNDIVNFFANLFIGLGQMLDIGSIPSSTPSTPPASSEPATPNTGDTAAVFVAFGTLCAASAAAFVCLKKKKA